MTIYDRVKSMSIERGLSIYRIEKDCGFSNGSIMKWENSSPKVENVIKLADYFNVSADYLLCLTDTPTPLNLVQEQKPSLMERPITALTTEMPELFKEQRFVDTAKIYNELPDEYRERAYGLIVGIALGIGLNVDVILGR